MSYLALARKWRPRSFAELVGQEHITKGLIKSINAARLHHAYLFTGTRGVGKTSIARLIAKALNCEQGISALPCLTCETCLAIERGCFVDLIEVDAASKTRVEDTRELMDTIVYAPSSGRYKVYIIDEVHMLSQHSFNALLKTLEEPPAHVKFLLATTDAQKIPITILSRCLQFNLKHLSPEIIANQLARILQAEELGFEPKALEILAKAARGSMRDALSLLDQAINSADKGLELSQVKTMLGYTQKDYAFLLLDSLAKLNPQSLLELCRHIGEEGGGFNLVLEQLIEALHQIAVVQQLEGISEERVEVLLNYPQEVISLARVFNPKDIQLFYQIGIKGLNELDLAPRASIGFEMTLLRMLAFKPADKMTRPVMAFEEEQSQSSKGAPPLNRVNDHQASLDKVKAETTDALLTPITASPQHPAKYHPHDEVAGKLLGSQKLATPIESMVKPQELELRESRETRVKAVLSNSPLSFKPEQGLNQEVTMNSLEDVPPWGRVPTLRNSSRSNEYREKPAIVDSENKAPTPLSKVGGPDTNIPLPNSQGLGIEFPSVNKSSTDGKHDSWGNILNTLKLTGLAKIAADNTHLKTKEETKVTLTADPRHGSLFTAQIQERIREALSAYFGQSITLILEFGDTLETTPAQKKQAELLLNQEQARLSLDEDPVLTKIKNEFSAEIVQNSIKMIQDEL